MLTSQLQHACGAEKGASASIRAEGEEEREEGANTKKQRGADTEGGDDMRMRVEAWVGEEGRRGERRLEERGEREGKERGGGDGMGERNRRGPGGEGRSRGDGMGGLGG